MKAVPSAASVLRFSGGSGENVTVRARSKRSEGQEKRSVTVSSMGRLKDCSRGSEVGAPVSRTATPTPAERRHKASVRFGERAEMWSKARIQLWRARLRSSRTEEGMGVRRAVQGSMRKRRRRAAQVLPEPGGPWRMRGGKGPLGRRAERSHARQRSQSAREETLRKERRASRAAGAGLASLAGPGGASAGGGSGAGRGLGGGGVWRRGLWP